MLVESCGELPLQVLIGQHAVSFLLVLIALCRAGRVSQGLAQPGQRTVGMGLHRARRAPEHRRCLLHRPVLPEPQHEHGPLLQRQSAAGTKQQLPVEHRSGGIARRGQRRQVRGERFRMPALPGPPPIPDQVEQDSPAVSRRGLPGRGPAASRTQQGLLDQILSIVPVTDQQERKTEQLPAILRHEGRELRIIPAGQPPAVSSSPHTASNDAHPRQVVSRRQQEERG